MLPTLLFGWLPTSRSILELLGKEFPNAIFRIIKWAPRSRASYETGMTALLHELQAQSRIPSSNIPNLVENFRRQHGIINCAQ
jgi:hypothetical protein